MGAPFEPEVLDRLPALVTVHAAAATHRRGPDTNKRGHAFTVPTATVGAL